MTNVSLSAIKASAVEQLVLRPDPSATTWSRLDPMPTSDDVGESLQARVADPLWLLARQWQFNELQGEDAGSPVRAALSVLGLPVHSLLSRPGDDATPAWPLDGEPAPIEALVEREQVLAAHPKLRAQAGQQLMRQLRAAGLDAVGEAVRAAYPAALPEPGDPVADNAGFVWHALLDQQAVDALAFAADLVPKLGDEAQLAAFANGFGAAGAQEAPCVAAFTGWQRWLQTLTLEAGTPGASPYWDPHRLEYAFALGAGDPQTGARLEADEYADGRLDWHTFSVAAAQAAPGGPVFQPPATTQAAWQRLLPALASYPGQPADRYWEFEDGRVNFGMLGAAKSDLARVAVLEYALVFGNDWFVLPLTLPVNALYKVDGFDVTDNFGVVSPIPPASNLDGTPWTMYEMSVKAGADGDPLAPRARLQDILYLCPAAQSLEGPALEHVVVMRDEMANMVWGIEKQVQGSSGEPLDRKYESTRLSTTQALRLPAGAAPTGAPLNYRLQTPVAANWLPFLPVRKDGATVDDWSIQLQRGVVVHAYQVDPTRLADPRNAGYAEVIARLNALPGYVQHETPAANPADNPLELYMFHPRGALLRLDPNADVTLDYLRLEDEEVPRDGIELKRRFNYARDAQGGARLWIGRSKTTGRGEGNSGLRFDVVSRG